MERSKPQFDYEAILAACGIQGVHVKKTLEEKNEAGAKFREQLDVFKKLYEEKNEKDEKLTASKLVQKEYMHKLDKIIKKTQTLNVEAKQIQSENVELRRELQKQSDDLVNNNLRMDEQLKALHSQFEGETLSTLVEEVDRELSRYRDMEGQLQSTYEELKNTKPELEGYQRLPVLKCLSAEMAEDISLDEIEKEMAKKKRNIGFLKAEHEKKVALLQKFD
ncbi:hypothetical protein NQ318_019805 [Aromia moschata]|uniref:Coiled-coil domain-containing protein 153 n=1 Tax=Aromia moschata TaxID=1265417 RepID=A0AAV8YJ42_9CUCU|nr:hypothetical protein NQ318_019805 [Aromia moschata]